MELVRPVTKALNETKRGRIRNTNVILELGVDEIKIAFKIGD